MANHSTNEMSLTRIDIAVKHRTSCMGGICKSNANKCFALIINKKTHYIDVVLPDGTIYYMGQDGGMNARNTSLNNSNWPLHVYMKVEGTYYYDYLGVYEKKDYAYAYVDKEGVERVVFLLKRGCLQDTEVLLTGDHT